MSNEDRTFLREVLIFSGLPKGTVEKDFQEWLVKFYDSYNKVKKEYDNENN
jgi:hypothetical protein